MTNVLKAYNPKHSVALSYLCHIPEGSISLLTLLVMPIRSHGTELHELGIFLLILAGLHEGLTRYFQLGNISICNIQGVSCIEPMEIFGHTAGNEISLIIYLMYNLFLSTASVSLSTISCLKTLCQIPPNLTTGVNFNNVTQVNIHQFISANIP